MFAAKHPGVCDISNGKEIQNEEDIEYFKVLRENVILCSVGPSIWKDQWKYLYKEQRVPKYASLLENERNGGEASWSTSTMLSTGRVSRGLREPKRVSAYQLSSELNKFNIDPHMLVEPFAYGDPIGAAPREHQPFKVIVHPQVGFICDIHSHLCDSEVIGLLAGVFDTDTATMYIQTAFPCTAIERRDGGYTDVELDPEADWLIRQSIEKMGMSVVGWYHSHPTFCAHPSVTDIFNQQMYQTFMRHSQSSTEPFIGLIVSPYDVALPGPEAAHKWFYAKPYYPNMKESKAPNNGASRAAAAVAAGVDVVNLDDSGVTDDAPAAAAAGDDAENEPATSSSRKRSNSNSSNYVSSAAATAVSETNTLREDQQECVYMAMKMEVTYLSCNIFEGFTHINMEGNTPYFAETESKPRSGSDANEMNIKTENNSKNSHSISISSSSNSSNSSSNGVVGSDSFTHLLLSGTEAEKAAVTAFEASVFGSQPEALLLLDPVLLSTSIQNRATRSHREKTGQSDEDAVSSTATTASSNVVIATTNTTDLSIEKIDVHKPDSINVSFAEQTVSSGSTYGTKTNNDKKEEGQERAERKEEEDVDVDVVKGGRRRQKGKDREAAELLLQKQSQQQCTFTSLLSSSSSSSLPSSVLVGTVPKFSKDSSSTVPLLPLRANSITAENGQADTIAQAISHTDVGIGCRRLPSGHTQNLPHASSVRRGNPDFTLLNLYEIRDEDAHQPKAVATEERSLSSKITNAAAVAPDTVKPKIIAESAGLTIATIEEAKKKSVSTTTAVSAFGLDTEPEVAIENKSNKRKKEVDLSMVEVRSSRRAPKARVLYNDVDQEKAKAEKLRLLHEEEEKQVAIAAATIAAGGRVTKSVAEKVAKAVREQEAAEERQRARDALAAEELRKSKSSTAANKHEKGSKEEVVQKKSKKSTEKSATSKKTDTKKKNGKNKTPMAAAAAADDDTVSNSGRDTKKRSKANVTDAAGAKKGTSSKSLKAAAAAAAVKLPMVEQSILEYLRRHPPISAGRSNGVSIDSNGDNSVTTATNSSDRNNIGSSGAPNFTGSIELQEKACALVCDAPAVWRGLGLLLVTLGVYYAQHKKRAEIVPQTTTALKSTSVSASASKAGAPEANCSANNSAEVSVSVNDMKDDNINTNTNTNNSSTSARMRGAGTWRGIRRVDKLRSSASRWLSMVSSSVETIARSSSGIDGGSRNTRTDSLSDFITTGSMTEKCSSKSKPVFSLEDESQIDPENAGTGDYFADPQNAIGNLCVECEDQPANPRASLSASVTVVTEVNRSSDNKNVLESSVLHSRTGDTLSVEPQQLLARHELYLNQFVDFLILCWSDLKPPPSSAKKK